MHLPSFSDVAPGQSNAFYKQKNLDQKNQLFQVCQTKRISVVHLIGAVLFNQIDQWSVHGFGLSEPTRCPQC